MDADRLWSLLGATPLPAPRHIDCREERRDGAVIEHMHLDFSGTVIRAILTRPEGAGPFPGLLYAHAHGNRYTMGADELIAGRSSLVSPYGPALAAEGYAALSIDMPAFGDRANLAEGPLAKALLWQGKTLFGQMLAELSGALTYLAQRPDIDPDRLGMLGFSMGATQAYFLPALDPRIKACAHLCGFADFSEMIVTGAHDQHGHYLTVPGLLAETSNGAIAGLIAPRAQLICNGEDDPLTPPSAMAKALREVRNAYAGCDTLDVFIAQGTPHKETAEMRETVLGFFRARL